MKTFKFPFLNETIFARKDCLVIFIPSFFWSYAFGKIKINSNILTVTSALKQNIRAFVAQ